MSKSWFITGTSSGFGREMTELLLARGDRVAATLRRPEALDDLKAQYGDQLWISRLDVTDTAAIRATVDAAFADLGRIDVVVNNAGYALLGAAEEVSDEQIQRQIDTNITGSIQVARAALPHLRRQGSGRIVQIASVLGQLAYPSMSIYAATKWAVEGFIEGLIQDVAAFGIDAILVEPGGARTNFAGSSAVMGQFMEAYEQSAVGDFRRMIASAGPAAFPGDPRKMAQAIIAAADQPQAPRRLTLGSDAYAAVHQALTGRLTELEAQRELAHSTDVID